MAQQRRSLDASETDKLKNQIGGSVILPENPMYDSSRKVYNAMIDKYPAIIVCCTNAGDVMEALQFAKKNSLPVAVRGSGIMVGA